MRWHRSMAKTWRSTRKPVYRPWIGAVEDTRIDEAMHKASRFPPSGYHHEEPFGKRVEGYARRVQRRFKHEQQMRAFPKAGSGELMECY